MAKTPTRPLRGAAKAAAEARAAKSAETRAVAASRERRSGPPQPASPAATGPTGFYNTAGAQRGQPARRSPLEDSEALIGRETPMEPDPRPRPSQETVSAAELPDDDGTAEFGFTDISALTGDVELPETPDLDTDPAAYARFVEFLQAHRTPLGAFTQKLALPHRRGYHRHWFNDKPGRLDQATRAGWHFVAGRDRKPIRRTVGMQQDGPLRAYAMEIPNPLWERDRAARERQAESRMDSVRNQVAVTAPNESAHRADAGKFYNPVENIRSSPVDIQRGA